MKVLGVTGGIGMGKSVAGELLVGLGVRVVDTDWLARGETESGTHGHAAIVREFGSGVLQQGGELDRARLADLVFSDTGARTRLEAILHPRIEQAWRGLLEQWRREDQPVSAVLIPLLFEREYETAFTAVVTVACTAGTQADRLRQRGWSPDQITARNAAQIPISEKISRARFVVWTEGNLKSHQRQWGRILELL